jgi:hypothetical protein
MSYAGSSNAGIGRVVKVDTTTYAITLESGKFSLATQHLDNDYSSIDSKNVVGFWYNQTDNKGYAQTFNINITYDANSFYEEEGQDSFIRRADNGLLYWFVDNRVHSIDGSVTGGSKGSFTNSILQFASYTQCVDAVDTNGRMYIAIHSHKNDSGQADSKTFSSNVAGVYVWDRQSTIARTRDFIPIQGVREIKRIFLSKMGEILLVAINNSRQCELRKLVSGKFIVQQTFEKDGYPEYRNSVFNIDNVVAWQGQNGLFYAWGSITEKEPQRLYKFGDLSSNSVGAFTPGVCIVGNENSSNPELAVLASWSDGSTHRLSKWFPNAINGGSVSASPNQGDVYTLVKFLPPMSTVNYISLYVNPISTNDSTEMGTINVFLNQSDTP